MYTRRPAPDANTQLLDHLGIEWRTNDATHVNVHMSGERMWPRVTVRRAVLPYQPDARGKKLAHYRAIYTLDDCGRNAQLDLDAMARAAQARVAKRIERSARQAKAAVREGFDQEHARSQHEYQSISLALRAIKYMPARTWGRSVLGEIYKDFVSMAQRAQQIPSVVLHPGEIMAWQEGPTWIYPVKTHGHTTLGTLLGTALLALALCWLGPVVLDGQPATWAQAEHSAEWLQATDAQDAQRQAARELRRDKAAAALCREAHGEAGYTWSAAGQLVCLPRRGRPVLQAATTAAGVEP